MPLIYFNVLYTNCIISFFEISLALNTPSVVNADTLTPNRRQDLHSLRLGPLASYDLGYRTWLESFDSTPYVILNENGSAGPTASHNGDAGTGSADGTTGHESIDDNTGLGSAHNDAGNESADGNAGHGSADGDAGHGSADGDLRDEFPWWDTVPGADLDDMRRL